MAVQLVIAPDATGIGIASMMKRQGSRGVLLFVPEAPLPVLIDVPNLVRKSQSETYANFMAFVEQERRRIDYAVVTMCKADFERSVKWGNNEVRGFADIVDKLVALDIPVVGATKGVEVMALWDLELKRHLGQEMAAALGLAVPATQHFEYFSECIKWMMVPERRKAWVIKANNNEFATIVPDDYDETQFWLFHLQKKHGDRCDFIVQERIFGTEVDIEGWFYDGEYIEGSANITLETKMSMPGDMGKQLGCATTVQKAVSEDSPLFRKALKPYFPLMRHFKYCGAFSVTVIVDKQNKVWYLENCARMGWDAFYASMELWDGTVDEFFKTVLGGASLRWRSGFGYGLRVWLPTTDLELHTQEAKQALKRFIKPELLSDAYMWGERAAKQHATIWWNDVVKTDDRLANGEVVYKVVDFIPVVITAYHEHSPFQAEKAAVRALQRLRCTVPICARVGDGAMLAYNRFMSLVDRGMVVTEERRGKAVRLTEQLEVMQAAQDLGQLGG